MNKNVVRFLIVTMLLSVVCLTGCNNDTVTENDYLLVTVNGGTGGGNYLENDLVMITPETQTGKTFSHWELKGGILSSSKEYAFNVTEDTTINAIFGDEIDSNPSLLSITVTGVAGKNGYFDTDADGVSSGFGSGQYLEGASCTLVALDTVSAYEEFVGWVEVDDKGTLDLTDDVAGEIVSTDKAYTFTVESTKKFAAKYDVNFMRLATPGPRSIVQGGIGANANTVSTLQFDQNMYKAFDTEEEYYAVYPDGESQVNFQKNISQLGSIEAAIAQLQGHNTNFVNNTTYDGSFKDNTVSVPDGGYGYFYAEGFPEYEDYATGSASAILYDYISMTAYRDPLYKGAHTDSFGYREEVKGYKFSVYTSEDATEPIGYFYAGSDNTDTSQRPGPFDILFYTDCTKMRPQGDPDKCSTRDFVLKAGAPNSANYNIVDKKGYNDVFGVAAPGYSCGISGNEFNSENGKSTYYVTAELISFKDVMLDENGLYVAPESITDANRDNYYYAIPSYQNAKVKITI